jgi:hypothetical protein
VVLRPRGHGDACSAQGDFIDVTISHMHSSVIEARREQMFPILEPAEIDRLRRFGELRSYPAGEALVWRLSDPPHAPLGGAERRPYRCGVMRHRRREGEETLETFVL